MPLAPAASTRTHSSRAAASAVPLPVPVPPPLPRLSRVVVPAGLTGAVLFTWLYGRTHHVAGVQPPWTWFGLLNAPNTLTQRGVVAAGAWAALSVVGLAWWALVRHARAGRLRVRAAAGIAALWAAPLALGPPLTSLDIYAYAAEGAQLVAGQDPYVDGPAALGGGSALLAMDPRWREAPSPYGPLGLDLEWLATLLTGGGATPTVLVLKLMCLLCAAAAVLLAVRLSRPRDRAFTLVALGANPLLLMNAVSGSHLEAPMLALLLGAVLADRLGKPKVALLLALAAGLVKAPALLALPFLVLDHLRRERRAGVLLRDLGVLAAGAAAATLTVRDAWGWTGTVLHTPAASRAAWTPSTALAWLVTHAARLVGLDPSFDVMLSVCRSLGFVAAAGLCAWLALRPGRRTWWLQLGYALTGLALLGFVVFPWYLLWGVPLLVLGLGRRAAAITAAAAGAFCCLYAMPELEDWRLLALGLRQGEHLLSSSVAVAVAVVALAAASGRLRARRDGDAAPTGPVPVVLLPEAAPDPVA